MKLDRIIWGVLLLFIGGVLLLDNFDVIDFYWLTIIKFIPVVFIIIGVNMLFNRKNSQTGNIISLGILVIALGFLFVKGQEETKLGDWIGNKFKNRTERHRKYTNVNFSEAFLAGDENKKAILNISGGATTFDFKGASDSLFAADVKKRVGEFSLTKMASDSANTLTFKMNDHEDRDWNFGSGNEVDFRLSAKPIWDMHVKIGAGEAKFDLADFKVRNFTFDGGVASLDMKIGSLLPIVDVNVKTGVTGIEINVPEASGCRIKAKTGLSSRDFEGFTKISENLYETPNFNGTTNKIFINFDGGITSFKVKRY